MVARDTSAADVIVGTALPSGSVDHSISAGHETAEVTQYVRACPFGGFAGESVTVIPYVDERDALRSTPGYRTT